MLPVYQSSLKVKQFLFSAARRHLKSDLCIVHVPGVGVRAGAGRIPGRLGEHGGEQGLRSHQVLYQRGRGTGQTSAQRQGDRWTHHTGRTILIWLVNKIISL